LGKLLAAVVHVPITAVLAVLNNAAKSLRLFIFCDCVFFGLLVMAFKILKSILLMDLLVLKKH
jgi:hypothetical protein